jgi:triphosphatase
MSDGDPQEIELKLQIAPESVPLLRRHSLLRRLRAGSPASQHLISTYFDTPDFRLMREQVALRVRKVDGRRIQTLKCAPTIEHGVHARREWEREVKADRPVLKGIKDKKLRKLLATQKVRNRLAPQFVTDIQRATWPLKLGNSRVELAVDTGEIRTAKGNVPVCEIEIELKSGDIDGVYAIARQLHKTIRFTSEPLTKAERGFALVADARPRPQRAQPLTLAEDCTLGEAFTRIARNCLLQLRANEAVVRDAQNPEGVHQFRVSLRRLRSALTAFRDLLPVSERRKIGTELRWMAQEFGRAREWDVFRRDVLAELGDQMLSDPAIASLAKAAKAAREAAYRSVVETIASPRYTETLLRLEAWLETGAWSEELGKERDERARVFARLALKRLHKRVAKLGENIKSLDEPQLHDLRLRAKKLRYAAEFFRTLFPSKSAKTYILALARIQERLGSLNDGAMVKHLLAELQRREQKLEPAVLARAGGLVAGWSAARVQSDIEMLPDAWKRFAALKPFWK